MRRALCSLLLAIGIAHLNATEATQPTLTGEGISAFKAGHYDLALEKFDAALKKEPKNIAALTTRALAYRQKKKYEEAIADFTTALRIKDDWFVYYDRGITYQESGDPDAAIADLSMALKIGPKETHCGQTVCWPGRTLTSTKRKRIRPFPISTR